MGGLRRSAALSMALAGLVALAAACTGGSVTSTRHAVGPAAPLPAADLERIGAMQILFGHQSVGFDILAGVADLAGGSAKAIVAVSEIEAPAAPAPTGITHFLAGQNGRPESKLADFARHVDAVEGSGPDVALLKFCYIDASADSDVNALFTLYKKTLADLRARHSKTTFVHLTMPIRTVQTGWKVPLKKLVRRPIGGYADNVKRQEYNELLRGEYGGREPVFDIAAIESTRADGSRVTFTVNGRTYFALAPEYTTDGGHLNELGRRVVAERLLGLLANIATQRSGPD